MAQGLRELARTRSFSRAAEERYVAQSAFSRRIRALETRLGAALIERSTYPTTPTPDGQRFRETAEETIRILHASRSEMRADRWPSQPMVAISALHTLALTFFPRWFRAIEARATPLASRLPPDDFHNCLRAIFEGGYDLLPTFHHPAVPILLDPDLYPHLVVGANSLVSPPTGDGDQAVAKALSSFDFRRREARFADGSSRRRGRAPIFFAAEAARISINRLCSSSSLSIALSPQGRRS